MATCAPTPAPPIPFYLEHSPWPAVHFLTASSLYLLLRRPLLCVLFLFLYEVIETGAFIVFSVDSDTGLTEQLADSIIGDPTMGALGIGVLWALDVSLHSEHNHCAFYWWARFLAFAAGALVSVITMFVSGSSGGDPNHVGVYVFGGVLIVGHAIAYSLPREGRWRPGYAVVPVFYGVMVATQCIIVLTTADGEGVWYRVFIAGWCFLFLAFAVSAGQRAHRCAFPVTTPCPYPSERHIQPYA